MEIGRIFTDNRFWIMLLLPVLMGLGFALYRWKTYQPYRSRFYRGHSSDSEYVNWTEIVLAFAGTFLFVLLMFNWGVSNRISYFPEQVGGFVIEKSYVDGKHEHESCDSNGNNCSTDTDYHREFYVKFDIGDWYSGNTKSERVHKVGDANSEPQFVPQWWTDSYIGQGVSLDNFYPNYIAPAYWDEFESTYSMLSSSMIDICPANYTARVAWNRVDKIQNLGFSPDSTLPVFMDTWEVSPVGVDLSLADRIENIPFYSDTAFGYLGGKVQGDVYIYYVNSQNSLYADMCTAKWKNGAKNAIYVFIFGEEVNGTFIGTSVQTRVGIEGNKDNDDFDYGADEIARSNHIMKSEINNTLYEYFALGGNALDRNKVLGIIYTSVANNFKRQEMATFKSNILLIYPTLGWTIFAWILNIIGNVIFFLWATTEESI